MYVHILNIVLCAFVSRELNRRSLNTADFKCRYVSGSESFDRKLPPVLSFTFVPVIRSCCVVRSCSHDAQPAAEKEKKTKGKSETFTARGTNKTVTF